jgi:peptidoglycan hydrolase CwlO-like protein
MKKKIFFFSINIQINFRSTYGSDSNDEAKKKEEAAKNETDANNTTADLQQIQDDVMKLNVMIEEMRGDLHKRRNEV